MLAGTQGGKTSFGPHWLYREIQLCGPGDYIVVTPTYPLLEKKALPEFLRLFERWLHLGKYHSQRRAFEFSEDGAKRTFGHFDPDKPTIVWFGYAADPESLESATAKAAWLDEAGQKKFRLPAWEAILRRLSLAEGRVLITTTPYDLGWLKQQVCDRAEAGDPDYAVVRFDSTENPLFPRAEFERARKTLPGWKFLLFYRAIFTRPAGLIYEHYEDAPRPQGHLCPRFTVPHEWPRYLGLDFGGVNTAGCFYAEDPGTRALGAKPGTGTLYLYRTYKAGGRTAKSHAAELLRGEPGVPVCVGGSHSEDQWRAEFKQAGLPVSEPPIKDVEVGIDRVNGAHAENKIVVFDDLTDYRDQKMSYSREVDENGDPTEAIENKASYHLLDAERYIIARLRDVPPSRRAVSF